MPVTKDIEVVRYTKEVTFFKLQFENGAEIPVGIDRDNGEVFVPNYFFPGGTRAGLLAASEVGDPVLIAKTGFFLRAEFVLRAKPNPRIEKAVIALMRVAENALLADRASEERGH